ncbi:MAG: T9SS type A sorting domain-containing protein [Ignavibacteriaceae bacterium]
MLNKIIWINIVFIVVSLPVLASQPGLRNMDSTAVPLLIQPANNSTYQATNNLFFNWTSVESANSYEFQYSPDSTFASLQNSQDLSVADTVFYLINLQNNIIYYWRVRSITGNLYGDWSAVSRFRTTLLPAVPSLLLPDNFVRNQDTVESFTWLSSNQNINFDFQLSEDSTFNSNNVLINNLITDTSLIVKNLNYDTFYYWRIESSNIDNIESNWSVTRSFKTLLPEPFLLSVVNLTSNSPDTLQIIWSKINNADNYQIYLSTDSSFIKSTKYFIAKTNTLSLTPLIPETIYYLKFKAENTGGDSSRWSTTYRFTSLSAAPSPVSPANFIRNQDTVVNLRWHNSNNNIYYRIQISSDSIFENNNLLINKYTADTSITISNLNYDTFYFWRIESFNKDSISSNWSFTNSFKTRLTGLILLSIANISSNNPDTLQITWNRVNDAASYQIYLATDSLFTKSLKTFVVKTNKLVLASYLPDTTYYLKIKAENPEGDSSLWSAIYSFTTPSVGPLLVSPVNFIRNQDTVVNLRWRSSDKTINYLIQVSPDSTFENNNLLITKFTTDTSITISNLNYGTYYFWRIESFNKDSIGSSWSITQSFKTRLSIPILLSPVNIPLSNPDTLHIIWNKVNDATNYQVYLATDSSFSKSFNMYLTKTDTLILTSLIPDTTYYMEFKAENSNGDSSRWSYIYSFKTGDFIVFNSGSIIDTINLSNNPGDSLIAIMISNRGHNPVTFDSMYVLPDTIFTLNKIFSTLIGNSSAIIQVKLNLLKILQGANSGIIRLTGKNSGGVSENFNLNLKIFIETAKGNFTPDTLNFNVVASDGAGYLGISAENYFGNTDLYIKSYSLIGPDSSSFILLQKPDTVKGGSSNYISIQFIPKNIGANNAVLLIGTNSYPNGLFKFILTGIGKGGEFSSESIKSAISFADSAFESINNNFKRLILKNSGDTTLKASISFSKNYFGFHNPGSYNPVIAPGDSVIDSLIYFTPNFRKQNIDTMEINHNGFGEKPIFVTLKGGFDSSRSVPEILNNLTVNKKIFSQAPSAFYKDSAIVFSIDSQIISSILNIDSRYYYYKGGDTIPSFAYTFDNLNHYIDPYFVTEKGLSINGELLIRGPNSTILDSIIIFKNYSPQVIIYNYNFSSSLIPISTPAQTAQEANVKWCFFGFPFNNVYVDTVFHFLGGIKNMKDGEWIIYKYDSSAAGSFSILNNEQFQAGSAYFIAQALADTFKISNLYYGSILTRSLMDTVISFSSDSWNTVSNPYLFNVQVEPPAILLKYDTNKKSYDMTNIMVPGEGYFVEPSVSSLNLKTFGQFQPLTMPKIIADADWSLALKIADNKTENTLLFSIADSKNLANKNNVRLPRNYLSPPRIQSGLFSFIRENSSALNYCASIKEGAEGAAWDVVLSDDLQNDNIALSSLLKGSLPSGFYLVVYDDVIGKIIEANQSSITLVKDAKYQLKIIVGTKNFISKILNEIKGLLPSEFSLDQNYPNPFNPATIINYSLPKSAFVKLIVYDVLGRVIKTLVDEEKSAGNYSVQFNGSNLSSGIYFYRLTAGNFIGTKKLVLLK